MVTAVTAVTAAALAPTAVATAATPTVVSSTNATIDQAYQHRDGSITVTGYAWNSAHPTVSTAVCLVASGTCVRADRPSAAFDAQHKLRGAHRFAALVRLPRTATRVTVASHTAHPRPLARRTISTPGGRVVTVARSFVGRARYTEGGASPRTGFDCSGLTLYSYRAAGVATLPHNADAQRRVAHMHRITRAQARPGDLIFYFSGGSAYHVAIYAGHGMQYAAATPRDGIRYQAIWSSAVEFRTNWH